MEKDGIKYVLESKSVSSAEKDWCYTIGADLKLGKDACFHCSASCFHEPGARDWEVSGESLQSAHPAGVKPY